MSVSEEQRAASQWRSQVDRVHEALDQGDRARAVQLSEEFNWPQEDFESVVMAWVWNGT